MNTAYFPRISAIANRDILQTDASSSLRAASDLMHQHNLSSVAYAIDGRPHILTIEHVLNFVHNGCTLDRPMSELPIAPAETVHEEQTVLDAMELMEATATRYLAVLDRHDKLSGIVTYTDIAGSIDPVFVIERKTVGEVVKRKELVTFSPDWILEDVLCHLTHVEDSIIVVDGEALVGIITSKDAFRIVLSGRGTDKPLTEYMTSPVVTVAASAPLHDALVLIKTKSIKRAVVVDDAKRLVGVVTQSELVGFAYGYWTRMLKHHSGELRELVAMLSDKAAKYRNDSLIDVLTGLGNRRMLSRRISEEVERFSRYGGAPFSFLLLDIDHFKRINEFFGHTVGDEVLIALGRAIQAAVRGIDNVSRWGADEFAILAPHSNIHSATAIASRILLSAENLMLRKDLRITVSIGLGEIADNEREKSLFERVDQALHRAKRDGRNRIEIAEFAPGRAN